MVTNNLYLQTYIFYREITLYYVCFFQNFRSEMFGTIFLKESIIQEIKSVSNLHNPKLCTRSKLQTLKHACIGLIIRIFIYVLYVQPHLNIYRRAAINFFLGPLLSAIIIYLPLLDPLMPKNICETNDQIY